MTHMRWETVKRQPRASPPMNLSLRGLYALARRKRDQGAAPHALPEMQVKLHEGSKITSYPSKYFHAQSDQSAKVKYVRFLPCATQLTTGDHSNNYHLSLREMESHGF